MNRHYKKALIGLPILLFIILNTYLFLLNESLFASEKPYEITTIEKRDLRENIHATGIIVPKETQEVYYEPHRGTIDEVLVEEGDEISAGSKIISYQSSDLENQISALESEIDELETEQDFHEDREDLLDDQIREEESKDDEEQNDSTIFLLEQEKSNAAYQANRIESKISSKENEITQLESQLDEKVVTSNIAGTVEEVNMNAGSSQKPIVVITSKNDVVARAYLNEDEVFLLKEGDEVEVTIAQEEKIKGIVAAIGKPDEEKEELRFPVDIEINSERYQLPIGSTVKVTAQPVAVQNAIAVKPDSILHDDGKDYVLVVKKDYIDKRKVSFGFENDSYKQVTKGLKAKEVIVKNPNILLVEDMEIETKNTNKVKKAKKNDSQENPTDDQTNEKSTNEENNETDTSREEEDAVDTDTEENDTP